MAALLGFYRSVTCEIETKASFIPNYSPVQDSTELKPEKTSKIIMLKDFSLEFTICIAVELSDKKSNFAISTYMMNFRKQNISS